MRTNLKEKPKIKLKTFPKFPCLGLKVHEKVSSLKTIIPHIQAGAYPRMYDAYWRFRRAELPSPSPPSSLAKSLYGTSLDTLEHSRT